MNKLIAMTLLAASMVFTACTSTPATTEATTEIATEATTETATEAAQSESASAETVEITDAHGTVQVPVNPQRVVSLDNRTFETLESWGVKLVAAPKAVMPDTLGYVQDENVQDIGNHREPNLEIIAAVDPDVVIVGQRFASYYDDIKALVPNAAVIDVNVDVSEEAADPSKNLVDGLKKSTEDMGKIFGKEAEAQALIEEFDTAVENAKNAYNPDETVMTVIISGGKVGYSAPGSGRVWGPLYNLLGWNSSLEVGNTSSNHMGDEISVEAIAQSNPDWLLILDRDAGTSEEDAVSAKDVLEQSEALQNITAIQENQLVYAPNDTYTNESIQTFIEIFNTITEHFNK